MRMRIMTLIGRLAVGKIIGKQYVIQVRSHMEATACARAKPGQA